LKRWIVIETAESKDAFKVQDKAKEREMSIETVEQPKNLHENSHDEIIDMCYSLGFTKEEVEENTKEYLISLIEMDLTLEGD
jgi:hypothetical protein